MRIADVRVNLRGFRRVMSQQPLDITQIGACLQQMRGKRMAQRDVKPVSRRMQSLIQIYRKFHKFIILFFDCPLLSIRCYYYAENQLFTPGPKGCN